ncbi:ketopantoate reductase family protein [Frigoribacterium sp. PhB24]|uniref:ketopantoate reductase family protein n=1 Tax=Frigoribacterium sp. PhB24 TaxID=2485204 RepID=UPI000FA9C4B6|nr:2-dehydropantoate 2-reductase [Frigoribacterium sp. PhB24]ROS51518.1 2-dehydropantoate 2-reductase [Frigoribacterium sp. PhB24]
MIPTYTVVGAGAIGGTLAAHLHLAGVDVHLVDTDPEHVAAIRENGLRIEHPDGELTARLPISTPDEAPGQLGAVLLAVKAQATDGVAAWIAPRLAGDGWVVSMQNGLNEPTIAHHVGAERTVAAFVDLFADVVAPGVVKDGGIGDIALGEFAGGTSDRVRTLADDLRHWGRPVVSDNVQGFLWSKLGFGAMLVASALADDDMGDLIDRHRVGMHALVREVLTVARAEGVALEGFDAFTPGAYLSAEAGGVDGPDAVTGRADGPDEATDALVAWLGRQTKKRSGIWRDIAVRGRRTEVPTQYAPVLAAAERHGVPVPLTRWLVESIVRLETGRIAMSEDHLVELDRRAAA